jgi:hypothetical protein
VSCDGIGGSVWVPSGTAGSGGANQLLKAGAGADDDHGLLLASAGAPGTGDPCTSDGCPETVAMGQGSPWGIAVDAGNLYWSNASDQTVMRMPFGGAPAVIASNSSATFAIDATDVYWVSPTSVIMKAPLTGGPAVTLADRSNITTQSVSTLAVDPAFVYWGEYRPCLGVLMKVPKAGGNPTSIASSNQQPPGQLAVDATNLYSSSFGAGVFKLPLAGGPPVVLASGGAYNLVIAGQTVVWSSANGLRRVPIAGGTPVEISPETTARSLATDGTDVFWGRGNGQVVSKPIAGGSEKVLANYQYPRGIAVDATSVYWTADDNVIRKVPRR